MSNWNEPIAKIYDSFNGWLNGRKNHVKAYIEPAKIKMCYSWYKGGANISVHDKKEYKPVLFPTEDIQAAYKDVLKGAGVNGDIIAQKFQAGNITADERAFYVRHALISELMACGFMEGTTNKFIEDSYINNIEKIIELSKKSKNDLEGN